MLEELRIGNVVGLPDETTLVVSREVLIKALSRAADDEIFRPLSLNQSTVSLLGFFEEEDAVFKNKDFPEVALVFLADVLELRILNNVLLRENMAAHRLQNLLLDLYGKQPEYVSPRDELAESLRAAADSVLHNYIPADKSLQQFNFTLNIEGHSYKVSYKKDFEGYWLFSSYVLLV